MDVECVNVTTLTYDCQHRKQIVKTVSFSHVKKEIALCRPRAEFRESEKAFSTG